MLAGVAVREPILGAMVSFGAYLTMVSYSQLDDRPRSSVIGAGIVALSLSAMAGANSAHRPIMIILGGTAFAVLQGLFEVIGGPLRMAAAMSVLSFLIAGPLVTRSVTPAQYSMLFALGAIGQGAVTALTGSVGGRDLRDYIHEIFGKLATARVFAAKMWIVAFITTLTAVFWPEPNAVWLASSALRVAKPDVAVLHRRTADRVLGTLGGGTVAAIAFTPALPPWFVVALVAVTIFAMQLLTASRYGWWTLCLTIVALSFVGIHGPQGWDVAGIRFGLTIAGAAVTLCVLHVGKNA
jgi:Fusaric acid resistance protein-like